MNVFEVVLDCIIDNGLDCNVYDGDNDLVVSGKLHKHYDDNGLAVYSIDYDRWLMRLTEIRYIDFTAVYAGLYLSF
jgi:hypothetical protein